MKVIARVRTDFKEKFGIPRQSGIIKELSGRIEFEKEYGTLESLRGLEEFSHLWILWEFSENKEKDWSPTVRPPKLGGNKRVGVFATRSPFRPNPIGMSCVRLERIEYTKKGAVLHIKGADILDNTPVYDIKPYLPYADSYPEATGGFTDNLDISPLKTEIKDEFFYELPEKIKEEILKILSGDPRPAYQNDDRIYGFKYSNLEIRFCVSENTATVISVDKI